MPGDNTSFQLKEVLTAAYGGLYLLGAFSLFLVEIALMA